MMQHGSRPLGFAFSPESTYKAPKFGGAPVWYSLPAHRPNLPRFRSKSRHPLRASNPTNGAPIEVVRRRNGMSASMSVRENFEILKDYVVFRPSGKVTLERAVEMVTDAIVFAREHCIRKLLVNTSNLTGFEPPSLTARYFFVHDWARAARDVRVAFVTRPERIDPQKFGITVAVNLGSIAEVFTSEEDALKWLEGLK
jgi:hypothetical protein